MDILGDVRLDIGDDDGTAASGSFGSSSFASASGEANFLGDIRIDIGDDSDTSGGGTLAGSHYLLSETHLDTVPGTPSQPSLIVSNASNLWTIFPSGAENTVLSTYGGAIVWTSTSGLTGPSGATGPQGPSGVAGPSGEAGPQGPIGPSGAQGIQGIQGPSGLQGIQGPSGVAGPSGAIGATGPTGPIGPSGAIGPSGLQGPPGNDGADGSDGAQGPPGPLVGWSGVLNVNNWSGPYQTIHEQTARFFESAVIGSGKPILWSNIAAPSGGFQLGLVPSGSGFLKITDGWVGNGQILFFSRSPSIWTPLPVDITQALDQLAQATGILAGGTGNPPSITETLEATLLAGDRTGTASGILIDSGDTIALASNANIRWSSNFNPGGLPNIAIGPDDTILRAFNPINGTPVSISGGTIYANGAMQIEAVEGGSALYLDGPNNSTYLYCGTLYPGREYLGLFAPGNVNFQVGGSGLIGNLTSTYLMDSQNPIFAIRDGSNSRYISAISRSGVNLGSGVRLTWSDSVGAESSPIISIQPISTAVLYTSGIHRANTVEIGNAFSANPIAINNSGISLVGFSNAQTSVGATGWFNAVITGPLSTSGVRLTHDNNGILLVQNALGEPGHVYYAPGATAGWSAPIPTNVTTALDALSKATGILAGGTGNPIQPVEGLAETTNAGSWSSITNVVLQGNSILKGNLLLPTSGLILWSANSIPSGTPKVLISSPSAGIISISGHLAYYPTTSSDWSAPVPTNVTEALDALAHATGILAGGTGNPLQAAENLELTLRAGNWSGPYDIVGQQKFYSTNFIELGSGIPILWSNVQSPSGTPQVGLLPSGSGVLKVTDGSNGNGHIFYSPSTPSNWTTEVPSTVDRALDLLVTGTGTGGSSSPQTWQQTLNRNNWSGPYSPVLEINTYSYGNLDIASGSYVGFSNGLNPSGAIDVAITIHDTGVLKIIGPGSGLASLLLASNSLYLGSTSSTGVAISAPANRTAMIRGADNSPGFLTVPGSGIDSEQFGRTANAPGDASIAIGRLSIASGASGIALGNQSAVWASGGIAIGHRANVNSAGFNAIAIGARANASHPYSISIGFNVQDIGNLGESILIGKNVSGSSNSLIIGHDSNNNATGSILIGSGLSGGGGGVTNAIAIGHASNTLVSNSVTIGYQAKAAAGIFTIGANHNGLSFHIPSGYLRIGNLPPGANITGDFVAESGDILSGGKHQCWFAYNQDSGNLKLGNSQGDGTISLDAVSRYIEVSGDIRYNKNRYVGTRVFDYTKGLSQTQVIVTEVSTVRCPSTGWPILGLPDTPTLGLIHTIKDGSGTASTNNIAISGSNNIRIDGQSQVSIVNNWGSLTVVYNGNDWSII